MTLKDLSNAKWERDSNDRPNVPAHAIPRTVFSDRTANELTKAILAFCKLLDIMASRTGSEGKYREGSNVVDVVGRTRVLKGMWLPGDNKGQGDVQIILKGRVYSVEVKIGKDKQSEVQKEFQAKMEKAGGVYVVVKTWEEFYNNYKIWTKK